MSGMRRSSNDEIGGRYAFDEPVRLDQPGLGVTLIVGRDGKIETVLDPG